MGEVLVVKKLQKDFPKKLRNVKVLYQGYKVGQRTELWENGVMEVVRTVHPGSNKCLTVLYGGQQIQRKGSCGPEGKSKQQQEGTEAQKRLKCGDLSDVLVKNIGLEVRQPWLKGLARRHASCVIIDKSFNGAEPLLAHV